MEKIKALILAGGRGSRLNELTCGRNKSLIEINGKPLIEYNLEHAISAGVDEIVLVVGYKAEEIMKKFGDNYKGKKIKYVLQKEQKGLVDAIECAKEYLDSDFLLMLADEILMNHDIKRMISRFYKENLFCICGVIKEEDKLKIGKTYSVMTNEAGRIFRLIEKPKYPINNFQGTGHCMFKKEILNYIEKTPVNSRRGEKELVDMIQCAVDEGMPVLMHEISKYYTNINTYEDFEYAKKILGI